MTEAERTMIKLSKFNPVIDKLGMDIAEKLAREIDEEINIPGVEFIKNPWINEPVINAPWIYAPMIPEGFPYSSKVVEIKDIERLLDLNDPEIMSMYRSWDMGDCSLIGLIEILLLQVIKKHKQENGCYYDTDYDRIKLRYSLTPIVN
jgi:hypothetical protein